MPVAKADHGSLNNVAAHVPERDDIQILPFTNEYEQQVFELSITEFRETEPINRAVGLSIVGSYNNFKDLVRAGLESGVSFVAIESSTGNVVGFLLSYVAEKGKLEPDFVDKYPSDAQSVMDFLHFMDGDVFDYVSPTICKVIKFQDVSVMEAFQRRQIAKKMVIASIEKAKSVGFDAITVVATNFISSRLFMSLGFEALKTVDMREYKDERTGEHVFASLPDEHRFGTLFIKYL